MNIKIQQAQKIHAPHMVALSYQKRRAYEQAQPQFWRYAGEKAEKVQMAYFEELIADKDHLCYVALANDQVTGFVIGKITTAPEVYDPGVLTLLIDDFCVQDGQAWSSIGSQLLTTVQEKAKTKGCSQAIIVSGAHDNIKNDFLKAQDANIASHWWVRSL